MEINELKIVFYAIPVYQLFYFTIQVLITQKPAATRVSMGVFMLSISILATFVAVKANNSISMHVVMPLALFLAASLPFTLYRYLFGMHINSNPNSMALLLKGLSLPLLILPAIYFILNTSLAGTRHPSSVSEAHKTLLGSGGAVFTTVFLLAVIYYLFWQLKNAALIYKLSRTTTQHPNPARQKAIKQLKIVYLRIAFTGFSLSLLLPVYFLGQLQQYTIGFTVYNTILLITSALLGNSTIKLFEKTHNEKSRQGYTPHQEVFRKHGIGLTPHNEKHNPFKDKAQSEQLKKKLIHLMNEKKPYTNPAFGLDDLCKMLGDNKRKVGYLINDIMGKNFYSLINEYRIEESIRLMNNTRNKYTLETIAKMAGFRSKTSFYSAFRKLKNVTPSKYRIHT